MARKNYEEEDLSNEEVAYVNRIIYNRRNKYVTRDQKKENHNYLDVYEHDFEIEDKMTPTVEETVSLKCDSQVKSASEYQDIITNEKLYKIVKALPLKNKEVLFRILGLQSSEKEIVEKLKIHRATLYRIEKRTLKDISKKYFGGDSNGK